MTDSTKSQLEFDTLFVGNNEGETAPQASPFPKAVRAEPPKSSKKTGKARSKSGQMAPMMRHYLEMKQRYPDYLLLYQVGDFYEIFFDDAVTAAECVGIRLTSRNKDDVEPIPMCGVPIHALDNYLPRLVAAGYRCVVMSQVDGDASKKGMVKREISRIVTPGIRYEGDGLDEKRHNYLAAGGMTSRATGVFCYADVSTGKLRLQEVETVEELLEAVDRVCPAEMLVPSSLHSIPVDRQEPWLRELKKTARSNDIQLRYRPFERGSKERAAAALRTSDPIVDELTPDLICALEVCLGYISEVSYGRGPEFSDVKVDEPRSTVVLDSATRRNLELTATQLDGSHRNSLLFHVNTAKTPMGSRLLSDWILSPSRNRSEIVERHEAVEELISRSDKLEALHRLLSGMGDVDRLLSRLCSTRIVPRDLAGLRDTLARLPEANDIVGGFASALFSAVHARFDTLSDLYQLLSQALEDEPPLRMNEGGMIRERYNEEIDRLRSIRTDGRAWLKRLEADERERTGISGLRIKYNNVFGYFIEISKAHLAKAPSNYERRQTLVNAERFITPELKEFETSILTAKDRQFELERESFLAIRSEVLNHAERIQFASRNLALIDALAAFAGISRDRGYTRPSMADNGSMEIEGGRHPVVELVLGAHNFVPNDTRMDTDSRRFAVLTGPNMGGKSTYLRQIGLIQILAQAGCFVPARRAELRVVDRVFTRIGAADDITRGDSTFMVEMREASTIVRKATPSSLVLIDEIGRGTATADGLAIATAIAEWLHDRVQCHTVFATHFHELTSLSDSKQAAFCLSVGIVERGSDISFTHHIEERPGDRSYGIEVARLAGLPDALVHRAAQLLEVTGQPSQQISDNLKDLAASDVVETGLSPVVERLEELSPNRMTPIEALAELARLKELTKM